MFIAAYVATVLSIHSLALTGFKFLVGFIYDRLGLRVTTTVCSVTAVTVAMHFIISIAGNVKKEVAAKEGAQH